MDRKECLEGNSLISEMKARGFLSNYFSLKQVLLGAVEQAESGKGKERHAEEGEPFERQIICEVARRVGLGYPLGQAVKKIYESQRLGGTKGLDELLGAINYVAAAYIVMQEHVKAETAKEQEEFNAQLDKAEDERRKHMFPKDHPLSFERQARVFAENNPPEEPDGNNPENPDSSPEFKPGDRVQFRDEIPSTSDPHWFDGVYVERLSDGGHVVKFGPHGHVIHCSDKEIRRAPKAEGCEELVQDEAEECRDCDGFQDGSIPEGCEGCMKTLEADAPQTPHDLYKRIIDANPATFHTPSYAEEQLDHHSRLQTHKPTGEELAEIAEEVPDGH